MSEAHDFPNHIGIGPNGENAKVKVFGLLRFDLVKFGVNGVVDCPFAFPLSRLPRQADDFGQTTIGIRNVYVFLELGPSCLLIGLEKEERHMEVIVYSRAKREMPNDYSLVFS